MTVYSERVKSALFWRQHGGPFLSKTNLSGSILSERIYFNGLHVAIAPARIPLDNIWYVLPVEAFAPCKSLRFYPEGCKRARFEQYREAWHLLHPKGESRHSRALP